MIDIDWNPSRRTLRQFSGIWLPLFAVVLGLSVARLSGAWTASLAIWGVTATIGLMGIVWPPLARPVFIGLVLLTLPIGWVVSHVLLALILFLVVTPIGVVLRLLGHDPLQLRDDPRRTTMWQTSGPMRPAADYTKQY
jgi:hypothetical protein